MKLTQISSFLLKIPGNQISGCGCPVDNQAENILPDVMAVDVDVGSIGDYNSTSKYTYLRPL